MEYNKTLDFKPALSNLEFYIGNTNPKEVIKDFREVKEGDELCVSFTMSALDLVKNKKSKNNQISLFIILFDRIKAVGFDLVNYWVLDLEEEEMQSIYNTVNIPLYTFEHTNRSYDFQTVYRELKVIVLDEEFDDNLLDKEAMVPFMRDPLPNELFSTKIPIVAERRVDFEK